MTKLWGLDYKKLPLISARGKGGSSGRVGRWWGGFFGELGVADPYKTPFSQEQIKTLDEPADPDMTLTSFGKVHCRETKQRELTERERQTERERE